jgi:hypothetical protein
MNTTATGIFLWGIIAGAMIINFRYIFLYRKFETKNLVVPKTHNTYRYLLHTHFRGRTRDGKKFVYCPVSLLVSWSAGDYDHEWCHACKLYFSDHVEQLLEPDERQQRRAQ